MGKTICIRRVAARMVANEAELDREQSDTRSVVVPSATFRQIVALAEAKKYRAPRGATYLPGQVTAFGQALREAVEELAKPPQVARRNASQTSLHQLTEYFQLTAHRKSLLAVLKFVEEGGGLQMSEV